jgi:two-component system response regulator FlrC
MSSIVSAAPVSAAAPVGDGAAMREVLAAALDVAAAGTTVLLLGDSGTGKEVLARHIHALSTRAAAPWVAVNCAALPGELLESELFGHERGAFTGASERRIGRIEQADGGTLLLDEVSELPLPLQAKLLRVLQEREVDRVGGGRPVRVDVRIIATSNRDLAQMVARKEFRADLYYRLCVFPIALPPLRERREDIPALAAHLLTTIAAREGRPAPQLSGEALVALGQQDFPGNVRELGNVIERALLRCRGPVLLAAHLGAAAGATGTPLCVPEAVAPSAPGPFTLGSLRLEELERLAIGEALRRVGGNRTHAARLLGISLRTLRNKLRAYRESQTSDEGMNVAPLDPGLADGATPSTAPGSWPPVVARASQEETLA